MSVRIAWLAAVVVMLLSGCAKKGEEAKAPPAEEGKLSGEAVAVAAVDEPEESAPAAEEAKDEGKECAHGGGKDCGRAEGYKGCEGEGDGPIAYPETEQRTDPDTGKEVTVAGAALGDAEKVSVQDLMARKEELSGKVVRLEGTVSAMCHHKRGWFAVAADGDRSGEVVRVLTAPTFLVPRGAIGRHVRTEGRVELIEVAAPAARHYAKGHKVGKEAEIPEQGTVHRVVVRATGAELR